MTINNLTTKLLNNKIQELLHNYLRRDDLQCAAVIGLTTLKCMVRAHYCLGNLKLDEKGYKYTTHFKL